MQWLLAIIAIGVGERIRRKRLRGEPLTAVEEAFSKIAGVLLLLFIYVLSGLFATMLTYSLLPDMTSEATHYITGFVAATVFWVVFLGVRYGRTEEE